MVLSKAEREQKINEFLGRKFEQFKIKPGEPAKIAARV